MIKSILKIILILLTLPALIFTGVVLHPVIAANYICAQIEMGMDENDIQLLLEKGNWDFKIYGNEATRKSNYVIRPAFQAFWPYDCYIKLDNKIAFDKYTAYF